MEIENNSRIDFPDTSVLMQNLVDASPPVTAGKETNTYVYWSVPSAWFTPPSVSKSRYCEVSVDQAKRLVTKPSVIAGEKNHLSSVLVSNEYPSSFVPWRAENKNSPKKRASRNLSPRPFYFMSKGYRSLSISAEGAATNTKQRTKGRSKSTNHSRPLWNIWGHAISRAHCLKKTSSKQSKRPDLHSKWPDRETNDNTLFFSIYHDE